MRRQRFRTKKIRKYKSTQSLRVNNTWAHSSTLFSFSVLVVLWLCCSYIYNTFLCSFSSLSLSIFFHYKPFQQVAIMILWKYILYCALMTFLSYHMKNDLSFLCFSFSFSFDFCFYFLHIKSYAIHFVTLIKKISCCSGWITIHHPWFLSSSATSLSNILISAYVIIIYYILVSNHYQSSLCSCTWVPFLLTIVASHGHDS